MPRSASRALGVGSSVASWQPASTTATTRRPARTKDRSEDGAIIVPRMMHHRRRPRRRRRAAYDGTRARLAPHGPPGSGHRRRRALDRLGGDSQQRGRRPGVRRSRPARRAERARLTGRHRRHERLGRSRARCRHAAVEADSGRRGTPSTALGLAAAASRCRWRRPCRSVALALVLGLLAVGSALAYDLWLSRTVASFVPYLVSFGLLPCGSPPALGYRSSASSSRRCWSVHSPSRRTSPTR